MLSDGLATQGLAAYRTLSRYKDFLLAVDLTHLVGYQHHPPLWRTPGVPS